MSVFITRCLHPRPPFTHVRQGQTGPSRIRLKRNNQKEVKGGSNDNPYIFHPRVRTVEPVRQALRNTKSIMIMGLPAVVLSGMNDLPFEYIMPQIKNGLVSSFSCVDNSLNVKRAHQKKGDIMNVIKAVWSSADRYPGLLRQTMSYRPQLKVTWSRFGYNFQVSGRTGLLFSSELALPNFASSADVEKTKIISVENKDELISPVFELSQNVSRRDFDSGFYHDMFRFPQTLVITEQNWKIQHLIAQVQKGGKEGTSIDAEIISKCLCSVPAANLLRTQVKTYRTGVQDAIMFSFGRLVERAVCRDGANFGNMLQNPLSIRSIVYNDKKMALLCYQLNTLDFDNNEGVKNQLWLSPEFPFFFTNAEDRESKNLLSCDKEGVDFPQNDFKELVALFLYGEGEDKLQERCVV